MMIHLRFFLLFIILVGCISTESKKYKSGNSILFDNGCMNVVAERLSQSSLNINSIGSSIHFNTLIDSIISGDSIKKLLKVHGLVPTHFGFNDSIDYAVQLFKYNYTEHEIHLFLYTQFASNRMQIDYSSTIFINGTANHFKLVSCNNNPNRIRMINGQLTYLQVDIQRMNIEYYILDLNKKNVVRSATRKLKMVNSLIEFS